VLAADTNVLARLVVSDDLAQQKAVRRRLDRALAAGEQVVLTTVVLAELAWVLDAAYGYGRESVALAIRTFVDTPPFFAPEKAQVLEALDAYDTGAAEFSDYLLLALARAAGAERLLTFDRKLLRDPACEKP
jgi:predicted nucleic-acid-binding protein